MTDQITVIMSTEETTGSGERWHADGCTVYDENRLTVLRATQAEDATLAAAAPALLALAKQYASECAECHGSGLVGIHFPGNEGVPEWDADDQPCPECADIRAVIAEAEGRS